MAKYLLLKHYRGAPRGVNDVPMDQWTPQEVQDHLQYMADFAARLEASGEFVDGQALSPEGTFVRSDGEGRPPITDGPFAETKDLIAGYWLWEIASMQEAIDWLCRSPFREHPEADVEIRPVFTAEDFGEALAPEVRAQEERIAAVAAALGGEIEVPTIDGGRSRVKIPPGTQSGRQLRLRGKGMPPLRHGPGMNGESGDMLIELSVETPVNLTARQRELLREFEGIKADNSPETQGFFQKIKGFWDEMKG